jgi:Cu+-exporting ATPase
MRIVPAILAALGLVACGGRGNEGGHGDEPHGAAPSGSGVVDTAVEGRAKDPVCLMTVENLTAQEPFVYKNTRYYFCSAECRRKFVASPPDYHAGQPGESCVCASQMANCRCGHCSGTPARCACAEEALRAAGGGEHGDGHDHEH